MKGVILDIPNLRQAADGLCWAACLVPIITYVTGQSFTQHQLAAAAGLRPADGATMHDMARALTMAHVRADDTPPLPAEATYKHLTNHRPLMLLVDVGQGFIAHCIVLRGLIYSGEWHALVNEPNLATHHAIFVSFARLRAAWRQGLIITGKTA